MTQETTLAFAASLFVCRRLAGRSRVWLGQQLGVTRNTIGNWETGRTEPTVSQANALALALECVFDGRVLRPLAHARRVHPLPP